jgi:hypothetical protein
MAKVYYITFGTGDPRTFTGLAPTFLTFNNNGTVVTPPSISEVTGATGFYSFTWGTTTPICFLADAATTSPGTSGRYVKGAIDPADRADEYGTTMIAIGTSHIAQGVSILAFGVTSLAIGTSHLAQGASLLALGNTSLGYGISLYAAGTSINAIGTTLTGIGTTLFGIGITTGLLAGFIGDTSSSFGTTSTDPSTVFGFLKRALEIREGNQVYTKATGILDFYNRGSSTLLREKTVSDSSTTTTKT